MTLATSRMVRISDLLIASCTIDLTCFQRSSGRLELVLTRTPANPATKAEAVSNATAVATLRRPDFAVIGILRMFLRRGHNLVLGVGGVVGRCLFAISSNDPDVPTGDNFVDRPLAAVTTCEFPGLQGAFDEHVVALVEADRDSDDSP